jgi:hypothetical protein
LQPLDCLISYSFFNVCSNFSCLFISYPFQRICSSAATCSSGYLFNVLQ